MGFYSDAQEAAGNARAASYAIDCTAREFAELLEGRLRSVTKDNMWRSHTLLCNLKRELSQYDAKKRKWKN